MTGPITRHRDIESLQTAARWPGADQNTTVILATRLAATRADAEGYRYFSELAVAGQAGAGLAAGTAEEVAAPAGSTPRTPRCGRCWRGPWSMIRPSRCGWGWRCRCGGCCGGRLPGQYPLLREAASGAGAGSDGWCIARFWLGYTALYSADLTGALGHFTAVCDAVGDRPPSRALADCLSRRSRALSELGRTAEAVDDGRRSLAISRELGYPAGEALALVNLGIAALYAGDGGGAVQLVRQAEQIRPASPAG